MEATASTRRPSMEAVEPIECAGGEEVRHLAPAEIVNRGVPVRVKAAARIGMLVKGSAVEIGQAVLVRGKMGGHPIEDDAEACSMRPVDETLKPGRIAEPPG
jgi:hypothetical protein